MKSKLQDMYIFARSYIFSTSPALCRKAVYIKYHETAN